MKKALDGLAAEFNHTLNVIAYDNYTNMWNAFIGKGETGAILMEANYYNIYNPLSVTIYLHHIFSSRP